MKKDKVISVVLFLFLIYVLMLPPSVTAQDRDPQDAVIQQVLTTSFQDLGYDNAPPNKLDYYESDGGWHYEQWANYEEDPPVVIGIAAYSTEQAAGAGLDSWRSDFQSRNGKEFLSTTFHGSPAWYYKESYAESTYTSSRNVWQSGRFWFYIYAHPSGGLEHSAEVVYANAQKYGLLTGGAAAQDSDGDGVNDDIDKCPNTKAGLTVDADGCPLTQAMTITVTTDKAAYVPGDTALISGNVSDSNGALAGVAVSVDVSGTILSATTDASGNYHVNFPIPADVSQVSYPTTATAAHAGYPSVSVNTIFSVQDALIVELSADADHYLIGDTVYFTIIVKDSKGNRVPSADLDITATRLGSGSTTNLAASTDGLGENVWSFIWGQGATGNTIAEGKLQIDVLASKTGYVDGSASKTLSGCGDLEKSELEDCLDCPEDCQCTANEICDPSGQYKSSESFCSPKVAYVFISKGLGWYHEWWASDDIKKIRRFYNSLGYTVPSNIYVDHINQIAKYLSRPSTKAIAYAGHGEDPGGTPTIEAAAATSGGYSIKTAIDTMSKNPGGFLYICQFETYAAKWIESKDKIDKIALGQVNHPNLEYAYLFSCYSLDDTSLRDYLLKSGGTYWGYKGKLPGNATLTKSIKP